ncbi:uncharacterized protein LOC141674025 [Apium graveolens]|uniref:uncharacterized protein LOC141674025 n=1 Tax=Apium graveolens TaxID=4045 RepID=UPI003D7A30B2
MEELSPDTWMTHIYNYIRAGTLSEDKLQARRLCYQAAKYVEYDGVLYKRGFNQPLLRCVDMEEGNYIFREVHEGICGNHSGGGSLALKILRQGYYWPTMKEDAFKFIRACDRFQRFANYLDTPTTSVTFSVSPWPFVMWGIDLIGELPKAKGFGIPYKLISDKGKHFNSKELRKLCKDLNIKKDFTAVYHLDLFIEEDAEVNQRLYLDLLDEARMNSQLKPAAYQQRIARYFNKKVKYVPHKVGDLVWRKVMPNTKITQHGVLGANWEGPYRIKAILWKGTYRLEDLDGKLIPRAGNAEHLQKYFQ